MNTSSNELVSIAVLKAKAGKEQALKEELLTLIEPTRAEPGNLDYVLFEQRDEQGTFYMREAFGDQAALDALKGAQESGDFAQYGEALQRLDDAVTKYQSTN